VDENSQDRPESPLWSLGTSLKKAENLDEQMQRVRLLINPMLMVFVSAFFMMKIMWLPGMIRMN